MYYVRLALLGIWLLIATFACMCFLPFRWKDPDMGALLSRLLGWGACVLFGIRVRVENAKELYLNQPCIYVGNHQSNLDVFTLGCMYPYRTVVIGKKELKWIPLFGLYFVGSGNILINRGNRASAIGGLEIAKNALLGSGKSIWIFPEGTRNPGSGLLPFKKGAFHLAIAAQVPIVPVIHQNVRSFFDVKQRRIVPGEILIRVLSPISTKGTTPEDLPRLMDELRARMLEAMRSPDLKFGPENLQEDTPATDAGHGAG